jgi:hypothetical protein
MDERKRHVFEDFPVERLPEELRDGRGAGERVTVTVEAAASAGAQTISDILDEMQDERVLKDDPVERIRALRAEWDHRDELHARIRRGEDV